MELRVLESRWSTRAAMTSVRRPMATVEPGHVEV